MDKPYTIRKSLFMSYKRCPQQGVYEYHTHDDSYGELNTTVDALLKGQIFHHAVEDIYTDMNTSQLSTLDLQEATDYIRKLFPQTTHRELTQWFDWYAYYDAQRFIELKKKGEERFFLPFLQEHYVSALIDGVNRTGHIDRIDKVGDKELVIVEYKTGKSYDPAKSWKLSDLKSELEWYRSIMAMMDEFKEYKIVGWKLINPTLGLTHLDTFHVLTKYSVNKNAKYFVEVLNGQKEAVKKIGMQCSWCKYSQECLKYEDKYHEIFGEYSKDLQED